ncbi:LuxR C-terminal-related transcriptional regulator [Luteolibacter luteus]|uniref:Response regulator transcription factor n=1 Tax=Luteolibacter luteus TaxID=2728835 RepID=A0A858RDA8_9BACT|nr:response regulator transcription factor [Luteolibacter luteus]QJE94578.1 response regulator transcription factor [Luteolibacter luteus]
MSDTTTAPLRIWILEDHANFAKQITRLISGEDDLICEKAFSHPDDLFAELNYCTSPPDLLMLDLGLPGKDGLQVLREVKVKVPEQKVVILTSFDDRERVYRAICNGASGYLLKTADPDDILSGIRDVMQGSAALSSPIANMILEGFAKHGPVDETEPLTSREEEVLRLLVKGFIKKEIGDQLDISQHTVDMHLRSVYRKLHVRTQTEAVSKALRKGLV